MVILQNVCKRNKQEKNKTQKSTRSARVPGAKSFVLSKNRNIKTKTPTQDAVGYKANVFAPKQGYITLGGLVGVQERRFQTPTAFVQ